MRHHFGVATGSMGLAVSVTRDGTAEDMIAAEEEVDVETQSAGQESFAHYTDAHKLYRNLLCLRQI
jgi:hypothetical protein